MESSCEFDIEPSGSIKCWEAIEWPNNCWPLKQCSTPYRVSGYVNAISPCLCSRKYNVVSLIYKYIIFGVNYWYLILVTVGCYFVFGISAVSSM
jgi:hypothetical protein